MKDTWFGDKRDLVKWGTLAHLAEREKLNAIVQIPYLRFGARGLLQTSTGAVDIHPEIWNFFRTVKSTEALAAKLGCEVHVIADAFNPRERGDYLREVLTRLAAVHGKRAVLLDPDTGLAPSSTDAEHASITEVAAIWNALTEGEWLIVYQHFWRTPGWKDEAQRRFEDWCQTGAIEVFSAPEIANDVIFLAAERGLYAHPSEEWIREVAQGVRGSICKRG